MKATATKQILSYYFKLNLTQQINKEKAKGLAIGLLSIDPDHREAQQVLGPEESIEVLSVIKTTCEILGDYKNAQKAFKNIRLVSCLQKKIPKKII